MNLAKTFALVITVAFTLVQTTACEKDRSEKKTPATKPTPAAEETARDTEPPSTEPDTKQPETAGGKALAFMETLATAIETNKDDCEKMADAVQQVFDANREFVALIEQMRAADPDTKKELESSEEHKTFETERGAERSSVMKRIRAADPCIAKVPRLAEAMKRLGKN